MNCQRIFRSGLSGFLRIIRSIRYKKSVDSFLGDFANNITKDTVPTLGGEGMSMALRKSDI